MTPRMSVRARAREIYGEMAQKLAPIGGEGARNADQSSPREGAAPPTPSPSPLLARASGGGEKEASSGAADLTSHIRELYEKSAVPVREIARIAGVTERTLYKYVEKGDWKRRYQVLRRGDAAAAANRGRRWQVAPERASDVAPSKGSGGRFIRREDIGKPHPSGLKALDPSGRGLALSAAAEASRLSGVAQEKARKQAAFEVFLKALDDNARFLADLRVARRSQGKGRGKAGPASAVQCQVLGLLAGNVEWSARRLELLIPDIEALGLHGPFPALADAGGAPPPAAPAPVPPGPARFDPDDFRAFGPPGG